MPLLGIMVGTVKNRLVKFPSETAQAYLMLYYGGRNGIKNFFMSLILSQGPVHLTQLAKHFPWAAWIQKCPSVLVLQREAQK